MGNWIEVSNNANYKLKPGEWVKVPNMKLLSLDIETWGLKEGYALQPWRAASKEGGIICGYVYTPDAECVVTMVEDFELGSEYLVCGWNLKFDIAWLQACGKKGLLGNKYLDGMLLLKRIMQDSSTYALKPTLEKFKDKIKFPKGVEYISGYSDAIEFKVGDPLFAYTQEERYALGKYCERDTVYTYWLVKYLMSVASKEDIKQCIRESTVSVLFANIWQQGIPLDRNEVDRQAVNLENQLTKLHAILAKVGLTEEILNSPKQLREFLQSTWDIKLTNLTPKGEYSVDQSVLKNLAFENKGILKKIFQLIVKRKSLQTEYDKFVCGARECCKEGNVVHPDPMMCSTYTGRMTYSISQTIKVPKQLKNGKTRLSTTKLITGIPIHQMKRGSLRKMLQAPEGYKLVELDFCGQEMRLIADIANEKTMIDFFNSNKDLHAYTAASIYGYDYDAFQELKTSKPDEYKNMRQLGKVTNLSLQYRLSAPNLYRVWHDKYELLDKTEADAERARNVYLSIYSRIPRYWREVVHAARNKGYTENKAGRKYTLNRWDGEDEWKSAQIAINFPIQSTGAEQKILALYQLKPFLLENGIVLAWDLHDGMFFFVPDCMMTYELIQEMVDIVDNLPYESAWEWSPKVKFPVEVKIGDTWGELKSL
jgi:DNA polymerase-1